jgi:hypothetical protein
MIRTVSSGSVFTTPPMMGGSIAAPIANPSAVAGSFRSFDTWLASTAIPSGGPTGNSSKGAGPSNCAIGQPAPFSISQSTRAHCRASGTCLEYSMITFALRASFNPSNNFSWLGTRGVPAFTMKLAQSDDLVVLGSDNGLLGSAYPLVEFEQNYRSGSFNYHAQKHEGCRECIQMAAARSLPNYPNANSQAAYDDGQDQQQLGHRRINAA